VRPDAAGEAIVQRARLRPDNVSGHSFDLIVVGSGVAGLSASLLGSTFGDVLLLTKARLADSNTAFAQGGIAASLAPGDSPDIHYQDTMVAVDGLGDPRAIRVLVEEGPGCVE